MSKAIIIAGNSRNDWLFRNAALQIRIEVFVNERGTPIEVENDKEDDEAIHIVAFIPKDATLSKDLFSHEQLHVYEADIEGSVPERVISDILNGNLVPVSTARVYAYGEYEGHKCYRIGRVAVLRELRQQFGVGKLMMKACEQVITSLSQKSSEDQFVLLLWALSDKTKFYEKNAYQLDIDPATGRLVEFLEKGLMHTKMVKFISSS